MCFLNDDEPFAITGPREISPKAVQSALMQGVKSGELRLPEHQNPTNSLIYISQKNWHEDRFVSTKDERPGHGSGRTIRSLLLALAPDHRLPSRE